MTTGSIYLCFYLWRQTNYFIVDYMSLRLVSYVYTSYDTFDSSLRQSEIYPLRTVFYNYTLYFEVPLRPPVPPRDCSKSETNSSDFNHP